jgi:alkylated DNA repair dioxygenase AlkB
MEPRAHRYKTPGVRESLIGGGWIRLHAHFVDDHEVAMAQLLSELPLREETITMFGREVPMPRRTCWHGDPGCAYRYSGRDFAPAPWTPGLRALRDRLEVATGVRFNSVLCNHYRGGQDSMGWHADDEAEIGPTPLDKRIASVSLGAPRRFLLRTREKDDRQTRRLVLGEGSLLEMGGPLQRDWQHAVPKTRRAVGPRLNLTYRVIVGRP